MTPFADDASTASVSDLSIENGRTAIMISGELRIGRDQAGLRRAKELKRVVDAIVDSLQAAGDLPTNAASDDKLTDAVANPFA